jgi:hypothetical protein
MAPIAPMAQFSRWVSASDVAGRLPWADPSSSLKLILLLSKPRPIIIISDYDYDNVPFAIPVFAFMALPPKPQGK